MFRQPSTTTTDKPSQYVDTLARDLGLNTSRKSNPFSEMFAPYRPRDWRGMIPEFLEAEKQRQRHIGRRRE